MEAIGSLFRNSLFRAAGRRRRERQQQSQEPQQSNRTADDLEERTPLPPSPSRSPLRKKRNKGGIINATDDSKQPKRCRLSDATISVQIPIAVCVVSKNENKIVGKRAFSVDIMN